MRILTIGIKELNHDKFIPCNDTGTVINKPPFGTCLWGSTMIKFPGGYVSSDWGRYCQNCFDNKNYPYGISYTLKKSARIFEVDTLDDYRRLLQDYGCDGFRKTEIDFYKLSQDYDAFHLTEEAFWKMRLPGFMSTEEEWEFFYEKHNADFYSYDAESWIIFNLECINEGSILNHNNVEYRY